MEGLFQEIARIPSDHAVGRYYAVLLTRADLTPAQLERIVAQAAVDIESDHEMASLLMEFVLFYGVSDATRDAYFRAVESIDSAHSRGQTLSAVINAEPRSAANPAGVVESALGIGSDYQREQALNALNPPAR